MTDAPSQSLIGHRYRLHELLGTGAMGTVHRAFDRLTGKYVALKQVWSAPSTASSLDSTASLNEDTNALRVALSEEFQILASLRHPHIVSVLDYGFDYNGNSGQQTRQPFFTMELLNNPKTIKEGAANQSLEGIANLLIQLLQALAYLHRHGIVHRDLKPGNVMVIDQDGQSFVKTLDFGLSAEQRRSDGTAGTLAYMAPELMDGASASAASDLYSVGVIGYEAIVGKHPFESASFSSLISNVMLGSPDWTTIDIALNQLAQSTSPNVLALTAILQKLMNRLPEQRYQNADDVIYDLSIALYLPINAESREIRESYLQSAKFVGREVELSWLAASLSKTLNGQGSAWLIGGESGVGKSRLINEVRTLASVWGAGVIMGQAVSDGGIPFQVWRDVIRYLALGVPLSDLEISILSSIAPDLPEMLERPVAAVPALAAQAAQARLFSTVTDLMKRYNGTLLMILEDLQWADSGSLLLLSAVISSIMLASSQQTSERHVMIIATYRDDEVPDLPERLSGMRLMKLSRFSSDDIAALSASMLGNTAGNQPHVIRLLERETEGNVFFLIEAVRTLAESAGSLGMVGTSTLPEHIFGGGMRKIVHHRLQRVPATSLPMLRLAAVIGRVLDIALLQSIDSGFDMENWLVECANISVLEIVNGHWQFAHDKLREGIIAELTPAQAESLHRQVAAAIEQVYRANLSPYYADLALHYRKANQPSQERQYAMLAGEQAAARFAHSAALDYLNRSFQLTPSDNLADRYRILSAREQIYGVQGMRQPQLEDIEALEQLAKALNDDQRQTEAALRRTAYSEITGNYAAALTTVEQVIQLAKTTGQKEAEATGYFHWGRTLMRQGKFTEARSYLQQSLELAQPLKAAELEMNALRNLGNVALELGEYNNARNYYEQSLRLSYQLGDRRGEGSTFNNLGEVERYTGNFGKARHYYEQALAARHEMSDKQGEALVLGNLGLVARHVGEFTTAQTHYGLALQLCREVGDRYSENWILLGLGFVAADVGQYDLARNYYEQTLALCRDTGQEDGITWALASLGLLFYHLGDLTQAELYSQDALTAAQKIGSVPLQAHALMTQGHIAYTQKNVDSASDHYQRALDLRRAIGELPLVPESLAGVASVKLAQGTTEQALDAVNEILAYLDGRTLDGTEEPIRIYLTCYEVLKSKGDLRADLLLYSANLFLQARAEKITNPEWKASFMNNIEKHRELHTLLTS